MMSINYVTHIKRRLRLFYIDVRAQIIQLVIFLYIATTFFQNLRLAASGLGLLLVLNLKKGGQACRLISIG